MTSPAVILFVYNRPEHTQRVVEGLKRNRVPKLYVFADGPKSREHAALVERTRDVIRSIDWCEVEAEYSVTNKGLANSVIGGVTKVFSKGHDSVIVLEDDCVPRENYIEFMSAALNHYADRQDVMHVSGFGLPIKKYTESDVYLTPYPCSWGWGTWADTWNGCDFEQTNRYEKLLRNPDEVKRFNYAGEAFSAFLQMQLDRKVNSWLIRWYHYIYSRNGRCVWCYDSLIENKGFDGTGVHSVSIDRFNQKNKRELKSLDQYRFEDHSDYNPLLIREFRRYFIDKSFKERLKTVVYMSTGILVEPKRSFESIK